MLRANSRYSNSMVVLFGLESLVFWAVVLGGGFLLFEGKAYPGQYAVIHACLVLGLYAFRGYDPVRLKNRTEAAIAAFQGALFGGILAVSILMTQFPRIPRPYFIPVFFAYLTAALVGRLIWSTWFTKKEKTTAAWIVGDESWKNLLSDIAAGLGTAFEPLTFAALPDLEDLPIPPQNGKKNGSLLIVADPEAIAEPGFHRVLNRLGAKGMSVDLLPNLAERALGRIPLEVAETFRNHYEVVFNDLVLDPVQRILDVTVALGALILLSPIMVLVALTIRMESKGGALFVQDRVGLDGTTYRMHKFRTMTVREEANGKPAFADKEEHRITRVGRFLRKTRLDELPQLWDVLVGNMSLVGPRPEQPAFVEQFRESIPFYDYRHEARPGITGWAQINYDYAYDLEGTKRKLEYDLYYVKRRSMMLDLQILLKTLEIMVGRRGAR
jgi:exopolysaccharide biosynthesis polyprenyl glycosylphosphotransferase